MTPQGSSELLLWPQADQSCGLRQVLELVRFWGLPLWGTSGPMPFVSRAADSLEVPAHGKGSLQVLAPCPQVIFPLCS